MVGSSAYGAARSFATSEIQDFLTKDGTYKGVWNAKTNVPAIADGTGDKADWYEVSVAGTFNGENFAVDDKIFYNGTKWQGVHTGLEINVPYTVDFIDENTTEIPTTRPSGKAFVKGDTIGLLDTAVLPFTLGGFTFNAKTDTLLWNGTTFQKSSAGASSSNAVSIADKTKESLSGDSDSQNEVNEENVKEFAKKEKTREAQKDYWFEKYKTDISASGDTEIYLSDIHNQPKANFVLYVDKLESIYSDGTTPIDLIVPYNSKKNVYIQSVDTSASEVIVAFDYDAGKKIVVTIASDNYIISTYDLVSTKEVDDKVDKSRKIADKDLTKDISVDDLVNAIKDVARTYTNLTLDCNDNSLKNIVASCFKSGTVLTSIPDTISTESYCFATAKAILDYVTSKCQGAIKVKGAKATKADIEALTDMQVNDEWFCQADSHFWLYTESGWIDAGGTVDLSNYIKKSDIVNNLESDDTQVPLSAAMGKKLKSDIDTKQDIIDIDDKSDEVETLNTGVAFTAKKLQTLLGMILTNIQGTLASPITDIKNERNEILRLPVLKSGYSYPSKLRINITEPAGTRYCTENKNAFFVSGGDYYINPDVASGKNFTVYSVNRVTASTTDGKTYDSSGNEIYIAERKKLNGIYEYEDGMPKVDHSNLEFTIDGTENPDIYVLKYVADSGYESVTSYMDSAGKTYTGEFLTLLKVTPTVDKDYMYQCYLYNKMLSILGRSFLVNEDGKFVEFSIKESEQSETIKATEKVATSYFNGFSGTVTVNVKSFLGNFSEITAEIEPHTTTDAEGNTVTDYYSVYVSGLNAIAGITIQKPM